MRTAASTRTQHSGRILLVDDNRDGVMARRSVLQELGYKVVPTGCGLDALKAVENEEFDLVITNYKMSPIDGIELITKLREKQFRNPIILLAGLADSLGLCPEDTGADVVIPKNAHEVSCLVRYTKRLLQPPSKKPPGAATSKGRAHSAGS